jgi:hypothetical protein
LIICSCSPCARRTQKERYHLISIQSNHRKRVRQLGT